MWHRLLMVHMDFECNRQIGKCFRLHRLHFKGFLYRIFHSSLCGLNGFCFALLLGTNAIIIEKVELRNRLKFFFSCHPTAYWLHILLFWLELVYSRSLSSFRGMSAND